MRSVEMAVLTATLLACVGLQTAAAGEVRFPVARTTIYPGQTIHRDALVWQKSVQPGAATEASLPDAARDMADLVGKVAQRTLVPGRRIVLGDVRLKAAVARGQVVPMVFRTAYILIRGRGVALQSGSVGGAMRIRSLNGGRVMTGVVGEDGVVLVGAEP